MNVTIVKINPNQKNVIPKPDNKFFENGWKNITKAIKKNKVLYFPSIEAGNPSFIVVLNADIINSLNKIIASDQKGIISILHSHNKGISINILSVNGSRIAPNLVLRFNFFAKYPSK